MEETLEQYKKQLEDSDFEVIQTPRLGWIIIRTDYQYYSNPILPIGSPEELELYINRK